MSERQRSGRAGLRLVEVDEIEIEIEKLVAGGEGLGRFEGIPIFVQRSAPGDHLRVRLVERRPDYGRAAIVEMLSPGPGRREPPCPFFERCGGCDLQHLEDDVQLRLKAEAARETLLRLGGIRMPSKVAVVPGKPWGYRLRNQLQVAETARGIEVGYFARGSHDLVPVDRCPILRPELEELLPRLPRLLRDTTHRRLDLAVGDGGRLTTAPVVEGLPHGEITLRVGELDYGFDARCFFQGHHDLLPALVEHAVGDWEGESAVDLYAGVGLFTVPLARRYRDVVAVEGDRVAARFGRRNAKRHRTGARLEVQSIETWIARLPKGVSRVVVDPPRRGLSWPVRRALLASRAERLSYVSCDVATLARDLKLLTRAYRVESLALLDMFPQTGHLEAVVQLVLEDEE